MTVHLSLWSAGFDIFALQPATLLKRCYRWTIAWADHPQAAAALFFIALVEASVFPIPPDVLLLLLGIARPAKALQLAAVTTAGSTFGALIGYALGMFLFTAVAEPLLRFYHAVEKFQQVQQWFVEYGAWVVAAAGFSPIPFKVITIAAGTVGLPLLPFIIATLLSRGLRFFLEGAILRWGGERMRAFLERHFEWLTAGIVLLLIMGFLALWLWR